MKKLLIGCLLLVLMVAGSALAKDRITTYEGSLIDSMIAIDTAKGSTNSFRLTNVSQGLKYDGMVGYVWVGEAYDLAALESDSVAGLGLVDSAIINVYAGTGYWKQLIASTSGSALPDTLFFRVSKDIWANGSEQLEPIDDTVASYWQPASDTLSSAWLQDWLWIEYFIVDTAGTGAGDSAAVNLNYWFRFYEDE